MSSSPLLLFQKTCHIFANLHNPLWRALASKPLNQLSSFTPFYKWEAMMNLHILSDSVSDFWKCPKKGLKKSYLRRFLVPNQTHATIARRHTWERECGHQLFLAMKTTLKVVFITSEQLIANVWSWRSMMEDKLYCTVLYCTVVNCPIFLREGSFKKQHPYLGQCPNRWGVWMNPNLLNRFSQVTGINCPKSKTKCPSVD